MEKVKNNILVYMVMLILFVLVFTIVRYVLIEFAINRAEVVLTVNVKTNEKDTVLSSINFPSVVPQVRRDTHLINSKWSTIKIPIEYKRHIGKIFIKSQLGSDLILGEINVNLNYRAFEYSVDEYYKEIQYMNFSMDVIDHEFEPNSNSIHVFPKTEYPYLFINEKFTSKVYRDLMWPIDYTSLGFSVLTLIIIILFKSRIQFLNNEMRSGTILVFVFVLILFIPFFTQKNYINQENRELAKMPDLSQNIWRIPNKYNRFFVDHFPYRVKLSRIHNYIKYWIFNSSPNPEKVQIGNDDFLFFADRDVRKIYQGKIQYSAEELFKIKQYLESTEKQLNEKNISFYLMVPPLKHSVYPEKLPSSLKLFSDNTKRKQLMKFLKEKTSIKIIDPLQNLLDLKDSIPIYYKSDTHWNEVAAFQVYQQMIDEIRQDYPTILQAKNLTDFNSATITDYQGDLVNLINLPKVFSRELIVLDSKFKKNVGSVGTLPVMANEQKYIYFTSKTLSEQPRLLMYRDSFGDYLYKHLSEHFSYSGFVNSKKLNPKRIEQIHPDILIFELMERYIDELLPRE